MIPVLVVALLPTPVRYDEHRHVEGADRTVEGAQVVEQADLPGDRLQQRENLAAFGEEVVVGIDQQVSGASQRVGCVGHDKCSVKMGGSVPWACRGSA
ncbi:hypothetical protein D3C73_1469920 [compost metagenome]